MATDGPTRPALRLASADRGDHATPLPGRNIPAALAPLALRAAPGRLAVTAPGRNIPDPFAFPAPADPSPRPALRPQAAAPRITRQTVGVEVGPREAEAARRRARAAVAAENHQAASHDFDPADPRWVLATRAAASIQGGRAGILPPDQRAGLIALGTRLGLRTFDSHLVIAIVQDAARTGRPVAEPDTRQQLAMIPTLAPYTPREAALGLGLRLAVAALLAVAIAGVAIGWIEA
jgi:hypothetical protein